MASVRRRSRACRPAAPNGGPPLLTATLANVHRKKGAKPFRPDDFLMRDPTPVPPPRALKSGNLSGFFAALDALADRPKA